MFRGFELDGRPNRRRGRGRNPGIASHVHLGLGTSAGLATDKKARVLDRERRPIAGLYACGNDMASVMGGHYPSGGITLGPAMTFGYIVAHDAAGASPPTAMRAEARTKAEFTR